MRRAGRGSSRPSTAILTPTSSIRWSIINRETKQVTYTGLYYYLAHFSKFVRPGAVRIETKGGAQKIRCLGFKTPEGGFVAQLLNSRSEPTEVQLNWRGQAVRVSLPALSISTCLWK